MLDELMTKLNETILEHLKRRNALEFERPSDVDKHDENLDSINNIIKILKAVRSDLEELL